VGAKALRTIVIVLGILILAAFAAVIWGIVNATDEDGNAALDAFPDAIALGLPSPQCRIVGADSEDGLLYVVTDGPADLPECNRVMIVDPASGRVATAVRP
jgi:hypothetical protein